MKKTILQKLYITLIFIFLYAPIVTLIVLSFNASKTRSEEHTSELQSPS